MEEKNTVAPYQRLMVQASSSQVIGSLTLQSGCCLSYWNLQIPAWTSTSQSSILAYLPISTIDIIQFSVLSWKRGKLQSTLNQDQWIRSPLESDDDADRLCRCYNHRKFPPHSTDRNQVSDYISQVYVRIVSLRDHLLQRHPCKVLYSG